MRFKWRLARLSNQARAEESRCELWLAGSLGCAREVAPDFRVVLLAQDQLGDFLGLRLATDPDKGLERHENSFAHVGSHGCCNLGAFAEQRAESQSSEL